jgi:hypothetical protein
MRKNALTRLIVPLSLGLVLAAAAGTARADDCAGLDVAKKTVCDEAAGQIRILESSWPAAARTGRPCAPARVILRLGGLVGGIKSAGPYLALEFAAHTDSIPYDGSTYSRSVLFLAEDDEVELSAENGLPLDSRPSGTCLARDDERTAITEAARAVETAITGYNKPALGQGAAQLKKLSDTWMWVITDGFGQFPWERVFNDLVHRRPLSIYRLPTIEWVLLHPSVGAEITSGSDFSETRAKGALLIESLGFVRYRFRIDQQKRHYLGASLLLVLREELSPGYGALFRYDRYSIGVVRHTSTSASGTGRDPTWGVTATVELLERLQAARTKLKTAEQRARSY